MRGGDAPRRSAASLRNQSFDSNGPDVRVRGNAWQVHEKYQSLARDAQMAGDRVAAENFLQHAEHYYRIIEAINEATAAEQAARGYGAQQPDVRGPYPAQQQQPAVNMDGSAQAFAQQPQAGAGEQPAAQAQQGNSGSPFFSQEDSEQDAERQKAANS